MRARSVSRATPGPAGIPRRADVTFHTALLPAAMQRAVTPSARRIRPAARKLGTPCAWPMQQQRARRSANRHAHQFR
jgi:hypothetical protein